MTEEYGQSTEYLQTLASRALQDLENVRAQLAAGVTAPPMIADTRFNVTLDKPTLTAPPKLSDLLQFEDSTNPEVLRLNAEADAYIEKYFPAINGCLKTCPEDWLCNVLEGIKPFGIDSTIFDMVWNTARDRASRQRRSDQQTIEANMSSRGFSIPPGALTSLSLIMQQKLADDVADVNRQEAIKDTEIKLDILKFAEDTAIKYKMEIMRCMADMYRAWLILPNNDLERTRIRAQAMATYYQALGAYYNVEMAFEELELRAAQTKSGISIDNAKLKLEAFQISRTGNTSLATAAQAFGDIAGKAALSAGTLVAQVESV